MNVKDYRLTKAVIDQLEPGMLLHNSSGRSFRQVIMIDHNRREVVVRIERGKKRFLWPGECASVRRC